jgi:hypothetical protein
VGPAFIFPGMGMPAFRLGHISPLHFFEQEFYFVLCLVAGTGAPVQIGAAAGANALAIGAADGLEGNEQVDLLDQDLFQVDLVIVVKDVFQVVLVEGGAALLDHFFGEQDDVEAGMDLELELLQAADANQGNGGLDIALGLDALVLSLEQDLVIDAFEEKTSFLDQVGIVQISAIVQRIALLGDFVDVYYHYPALSRFSLE